MLNNRLLYRSACINRDGFTLVELLVVIGIIAILAGVALGPITNGMQQAKHNAAMQMGRQIGQMCFSYSIDNTQHGNAYPSDTSSANIASDLINDNYASDPSVFLVAGQVGTGVYTMPAAGTAAHMAASNCSWSFTRISFSTLGGITSAASDLTPLVFFNRSPGTALLSAFTPNGAGNSPIVLLQTCPFGTDGIAVFYKGNNAVYIKAIATQIPAGRFISVNDQDTGDYTVAP